jgi:hypothetical protein
MIPADFEAISKAHIEALVTNAVNEGRTIEYKQELPGGTDDDKKEFLADVSSFANAAGGDIVYGLTEQRDERGKPTGIPDKAEGLAGINADQQKRRLEEMIRTGIDPRLPGLRINHYDGFPSGPVIVIRVPKSWAGPHMVAFKNHSRFFTRNSAGKYQLDVREIRAAFTASGDLRAKITAFRTDRVGKIIANEAPFDLPATPKIILHLVPLTILDPVIQFDLAPVSNDPSLVTPISNSGYDRRNNLDGYLSYRFTGQGGKGDGYCQLFRSGAFEAVDADLLNASADVKLVASTYVEEHVLQATARYFKAARRIGVPMPLIVMATVTGLKGYGMATGSVWLNFQPTCTIDRDVLLFPDALVDNYGVSADVALKPIFDAFWQSAGFECCPHYDANGRWRKPSQ